MALYFLFALSLFSSALASEETTAADPLIRQVVSDTAEHHFSLFKVKYGKTYATEEEHDHRFSVFKANLGRAKRRQLLDPSAVHGVTKFSDLTPSEFEKSYLGLHQRRLKLPVDANEAPLLPTSDLPTDFDWRDHGAVTGVKDQGSCGSCWTFSAAGAIEGAHYLATGELLNLSEQQILDCDHQCDPEGYCDYGCIGGWMNNALEYTLKVGGLQSDKDYPYTATDDGVCKFNPNKIAAVVSNFSVVSIDDHQIAANLVKYGPLSVGINAGWMQSYVGGVSCPYICAKSTINHGVVMVGYGAGANAPICLKEKPYWIIKNSWGENWGENGYYKICRGHNVCGVESMVSTVTAASHN